MEIFQHSLPEPFDVPGRALHQFLKGGDMVTVHKALQVAAINILRRRPPDDIASKLKPFHADLLAILRRLN